MVRSPVPRFTGTLAERLERDWIPEPNSGCWLWLTHCCSKGYGQFGWRGRFLLAHRVAWEVAKGPIPAGMHVLHNCDVPACVNPAHLRLGTHQENMRDKTLRLRQPRGLRTWNGKLSEDDIRAIRVDRRVRRVIAAQYGVATSLITDIINRKRRAYVKDIPAPLFVGVQTPERPDAPAIPAALREAA